MKNEGYLTEVEYSRNEINRLKEIFALDEKLIFEKLCCEENCRVIQLLLEEQLMLFPSLIENYIVSNKENLQEAMVKHNVYKILRNKKRLRQFFLNKLKEKDMQEDYEITEEKCKECNEKDLFFTIDSYTSILEEKCQKLKDKESKKESKKERDGFNDGKKIPFIKKKLSLSDVYKMTWLKFSNLSKKEKLVFTFNVYYYGIACSDFYCGDIDVDMRETLFKFVANFAKEITKNMEVIENKGYCEILSEKIENSILDKFQTKNGYSPSGMELISMVVNIMCNDAFSYGIHNLQPEEIKGVLEILVNYSIFDEERKDFELEYTNSICYIYNFYKIAMYMDKKNFSKVEENLNKMLRYYQKMNWLKENDIEWMVKNLYAGYFNVLTEETKKMMPDSFWQEAYRYNNSLWPYLPEHLLFEL